MITIVERETSNVSYSSTGSSPTRESRGAGPERPRAGDDAELDLVGATRHASWPLGRVELLVGDDYAVEGLELEGMATVGGVVHDRVVIDELEVHVGEEFDLAGNRISKLSVADDRGALRRREPAPEPAGDATQHVAASTRPATPRRGRRGSAPRPA